MEPRFELLFRTVLKDSSKEKLLTENVGLDSASIRKIMINNKGLTKKEADELGTIRNTREQFRQIVKKVIEKVSGNPLYLITAYSF